MVQELRNLTSHLLPPFEIPGDKTTAAAIFKVLAEHLHDHPRIPAIYGREQFHYGYVAIFQNR